MDSPQTPYTASCTWCGQLLTRDGETALMCVVPGEFAVSDPHHCSSSRDADSSDRWVY
ncbi:MAG: hypothetical protein JWP46_343 [Modestobacter sp.]|nr:hypothetical protein [Modestobacter sp.]